MPNFADLVRESVTSQHIRFKPVTTMHEAYGLIFEELDEFWDLVKLKEGQADPAHILGELVDIAAVSQKIAEDFELTLALPPDQAKLDIIDRQKKRIELLETHLQAIRDKLIVRKLIMESPLQKGSMQGMMAYPQDIIDQIDLLLNG